MRNAFADEITRIGAEDSRVVLLSADIGNRLFDKFKTKQGDRFFNCGVAEANMISLAAGLASCGMRPVCYTIAPFITARCFEQIRVDVAYHGMPVTIIGTGAGLSYASLGVTHHSMEDIALLRTLPGMRVLAPADGAEVRSCLRTALACDSPVYIRIGKKGEPTVFSSPPDFQFGVWNRLVPGDQVAILSTGIMLPIGLDAAKTLTERGIESSVYNCACVKPLDENVLASIFHRCQIVVTLEEHGKIGGFGSAVAEWLADFENHPRARLVRIGSEDCFLHEACEQEHARALYGLTSKALVEKVQSALVRQAR